MLKVQDKVRHVIKRSYGFGTIFHIVGIYATVHWDNGGSSLEPIRNLKKVEQ